MPRLLDEVPLCSLVPWSCAVVVLLVLLPFGGPTNALASSTRADAIPKDVLDEVCRCMRVSAR